MKNKFLIIFTITLCADNSYSSQQKPETPKKNHDFQRLQERTWGEEAMLIHYRRTKLQPKWDEELEKAQQNAQQENAPHPLAWSQPQILLPRLLRSLIGFN